MSLLAMSLGVRFCASRKGRTGGGGWAPVLGYFGEKALVGAMWAISNLLCMTGLRKVFWPCGASISDN